MLDGLYPCCNWDQSVPHSSAASRSILQLQNSAEGCTSLQDRSMYAYACVDCSK